MKTRLGFGKTSSIEVQRVNSSLISSTVADEHSHRRCMNEWAWLGSKKIFPKIVQL